MKDSLKLLRSTAALTALAVKVMEADPQREGETFRLVGEDTDGGHSLYFDFRLGAPHRGPYYIGIGTEGRLGQEERKNVLHQNITRKYGILRIYFWMEDASVTGSWEKRLIKRFRTEGVKIANVDDGGQLPSGGEEKSKIMKIAHNKPEARANHSEGASEVMSIKMLSRSHDGPFKKKEVAASFLQNNHWDVWEYFVSLPDATHRMAYARAHFNPDSIEFKRTLSMTRGATLCCLAKSRGCQTLRSIGAWKVARAFLEDKAPEALAVAETQFEYEDELLDYYRKLLGITHDKSKSKFGYILTPERTREVRAAARAKGYNAKGCREQAETYLNKNHKEFFDALVARYLEEDKENAALLS